jgi:hypothetical protein
MTTDLRCPTTEAVNSRLLILPFCVDAIVHKHAATLRQLPGNIFDVGQSGSLGHYRPPSRILRKANFLAPHYHNVDCFNAFQKRIDVRQSLVETKLAVPAAFYEGCVQRPVKATGRTVRCTGTSRRLATD